MTNHDPRTIVGIKNDGNVVFITIDGRQPGFSIGMTGKELGAFILSYGINNAAMLDGGASTEMIVQGKIVNRLSAGGQERPVGGGIVVQLTSNKGQ
jgi:exopolysaccharide biosynthesis protein